VGRIAIIIAVSYGILGGVVVIAIAALVWGSTRARSRQTNLHKLAEREKTWFGIVVVMLVALLFATIWFTPYSRSQGNGQNFPVKAEQFAFVVPGRVLHAGVPVKFLAHLGRRQPRLRGVRLGQRAALPGPGDA
jgi:H+/Cl- antiporter ClcA